MAVPGLYPLSTQDGKAIPLDVVSPLSLIPFTLVAATPKAITFPVGYSLVYLYSTVTCFIQFNENVLPAALVDATEYVDAMMLPADTIVTAYVGDGIEALNASVVASAAGVLYVNSVEHWAALVQRLQSTIG